MMSTLLFLLAPVVLAMLLLWRYPVYRRPRLTALAIYVGIMAGLIWWALKLVAWIAGAHVVLTEIALILWFTFAWRLAWTLWCRTIGRWGQRWVRWGRLERRQGRRPPRMIRWIPFGRAALTTLLFFPVFLSMVVTHRCKLGDGQNPSLFGFDYQSVRIPTSDGLLLDGWFIPQVGSDRTIVICHGAGANKGNFIWFLSPLAGHGYNIVFFDFRAHGASGGRVTTYGLRERLDVLAVVDWLRRERPDASRVIVGLGSSQGAMALALAAAEEPRIDAVILDSPFVSPRELVQEHARRLPVVGPVLGNWMLALVSAQTGVNFFGSSAERAVAALGHRPVLVIHGDDDFIMPRSHAQRLYNSAPGEREIWFGPGPHSNIMTADTQGYEEHVFNFLDKCLGPVIPKPKYRPVIPRRSSPATAPAETASAPQG